MLLHLSRLPARVVGVELPGTRAPLSPGHQEATDLHAPDNTTSHCACLCLLSLWEPSSARKATPSRMSPNRRSQSKQQHLTLLEFNLSFIFWVSM